jgi:cytidyltransferase-like protein
MACEFDSMKVVLCGTWDYVHEGHTALFDYVKKAYGYIDRVYVTTDEFVASKKTPTHPQQNRWMAVEKYLGKRTQIEYISSKEDFQDSIKQEAPCVVIHGDDHNIETLSEIYGVSHDWWEKNQIYLFYKDRHPGISSTELRKNEKKN